MILWHQLWLRNRVQSRPDDSKMKSPSAIFACGSRSSLPAQRFPDCSNSSIDTQSSQWHAILRRISLPFPSSERLFPVVQTSSFSKTRRLDSGSIQLHQKKEKYLIRRSFILGGGRGDGRFASIRIINRFLDEFSS